MDVSIGDAFRPDVSMDAGPDVSIPDAGPLCDSADLPCIVDRIVATARERGPLRGVSVAIASVAETLLLRSYGVADAENSIPANDDTVYRIGSITKQFTAAGIMRLVEAGLVDLDADMRTYLTAFPEQRTADGVTHVVTVRQLLGHVSGVQDYLRLDDDWLITAEGHSREGAIAVVQMQTLHFAPGTEFSYSNSNYLLLSAIIESASGRDFAAFMETEVLSRADMPDTSFCPGASLDVPRLAQGYWVFEGRLEVAPAGPDAITGDGEICSTVSDLLAWQRALISGDVVSLASFEQMRTPGRLNDGSETIYGMGLGVLDKFGHRFVGHGGSLPGFIAQLTHYPDDDFIVVVLGNTADVGGDDVVPLIADGIERHLLGIEEPEVLDLLLSDDELAPYEGTYAAEGIGEIVISTDDSRLVGQLPGMESETLLAQGDHVFVPRSDVASRVVFTVEGETASAIAIRFSALGEVVGYRVP